MGHLNVQPANPVAPPRAQRFEGRFLGRKTRRKPLGPVLEPFAIGDLIRGVQPLAEPPSVPLKRLLDAAGLDDVHPCAHNHSGFLCSPRTPLGRMCLARLLDLSPPPTLASL